MEHTINLMVPTHPTVLVVEPRPLLGTFTMYVLSVLGARGVGPFTCRGCALEWLTEHEGGVDAALISTGLADCGAYTLASELAARSIPSAFMCKAECTLPWEYRDWPVLVLPYSQADVKNALHSLQSAALRLELPMF